MASSRVTLPSGVDSRVGFFDRFATAAARWVSRAWFFAACVLLVVVWAPSFWLFESVDTWQLVINTATTIVTFLLVALLQNSQQRADQATQHKLNAVALGFAALMDSILADTVGGNIDVERLLVEKLTEARRELLAAVGLEDHESA